MSALESKPWYREPWPWILMSGPAVVVVAGAVTMWIAFASADGVVVGDYYKRGLAMNQDLQREQAAQQLAPGTTSACAWRRSLPASTNPGCRHCPRGAGESCSKTRAANGA